MPYRGQQQYRSGERGGVPYYQHILDEHRAENPSPIYVPNTCPRCGEDVQPGDPKLCFDELIDQIFECNQQKGNEHAGNGEVPSS